MKKSTEFQTAHNRMENTGIFNQKLSVLTCQNITLHFTLTFQAEKSQVRPNICSCNLTTLEVDNCQNSNFCGAVFSLGSLGMSESSECLCQRGALGCTLSLCSPEPQVLFQPPAQLLVLSSVISLPSVARTVWIALLIAL